MEMEENLNAFEMMGKIIWLFVFDEEEKLVEGIKRKMRQMETDSLTESGRT